MVHFSRDFLLSQFQLLSLWRSQSRWPLSDCSRSKLCKKRGSSPWGQIKTLMQNLHWELSGKFRLWHKEQSAPLSSDALVNFYSRFHQRNRNIFLKNLITFLTSKVMFLSFFFSHRKKDNVSMSVRTLCYNPKDMLDSIMLANYSSKECLMTPQPSEDGLLFICGCIGDHECNDRLIFDKGANGIAWKVVHSNEYFITIKTCFSVKTFCFDIQNHGSIPEHTELPM